MYLSLTLQLSSQRSAGRDFIRFKRILQVTRRRNVDSRSRRRSLALQYCRSVSVWSRTAGLASHENALWSLLHSDELIMGSTASSMLLG
jgi:hypothetical protein